MATTYGQSIADFASQFTGKIPYASNGFTSGPASDILSGARKITSDCSAFVQYIFAQAGAALPRNAADQFQATQNPSSISEGTVAKSNLKPGDLLFFGKWPNTNTGYAGVQHVGIYVGNGNFVEEGGATQNVNVTPLSGFASNFIAATRPIISSSAQSSSALTKMNETGGTSAPKTTTSTTSTSSTTPTSTDTPIDSITNFIGSGGPVGAALGALGFGNPITEASNAISGTAYDIAAYIAVGALALVLIIGGILLLRPQTASEVGSAVGNTAKSAAVVAAA